MCRRHTVCVIAFGDDMHQTRFASLNDHLGFAQMVFRPVEAQCARRHAVCVNAFGVDMSQTRYASLMTMWASPTWSYACLGVVFQ